MFKLLRGPVPLLLILTGLILAAYRGLWDPATRPADAGAFPVSDLLLRGLDAIGDADRGAFFRGLVIALAGLSAWLFQGLVYRWTGNRIVSLCAAGLFILHPALRESLLGEDALLHLAPALLVLAALALRERGVLAASGGRRVLPFEVAAFVVFLAALAAGPVALAAPVLMLLVEASFRQGAQRPRVSTLMPRFLLWCLAAAGSLHLFAPESITWHGSLRLFEERTPRLLGIGDAFSTYHDLLTGGLVGVGFLAFAIGFVSLARAPRWVVMYLGFGILWYLVVEGVALAGAIAERGAPQLLAYAGPALFVPALTWRVLLRAFPPPVVVEDAIHPPPPDLVSLRERLQAVDYAPSLPGTQAPAARVADDTPVPAETRVAVAAAVEGAVEAAVKATLKSLAEEKPESAEATARVAALLDEAEVAARTRADKRRARRLAHAWDEAETLRNVFDGYALPFLTPGSKVLALGLGGGAWPARLAAVAAHVVAQGEDREEVDRARKQVENDSRISWVAAEGPGLSAYAAASFDLVFAPTWFLHRSQTDIFLHLQDLRRVLRPGGHAVLAFANLDDPIGFDQFAESCRSRRAGDDAPERNWLTPDLVRTLVERAGLHLEAVHLAADDRDLFAVISPVAQEGAQVGTA